MARITVKTTAYARNKHYLQIADRLIAHGYDFTPNVAVDGEVSIDTNAPRAIVDAAVANMPKSVKIERY